MNFYQSCKILQTFARIGTELFYIKEINVNRARSSCFLSSEYNTASLFSVALSLFVSESYDVL